MAEGTGVQSSETRTEARSEDGERGSFFKRNKALVLGGGGVLAFLLLSHKGSSANQNQNASTADGNAVIPPTPDQAFGVSGVNNGLGDGGSSGGDGSDPGTGATANGNGNSPDLSGLTDAVNNLAAAEAANAATNRNQDQSSSEPATTGATKAKKTTGSKRGKQTADRKRTQRHANPNTHHSGGHGVTVHGRTFPGATSHHVGPDIRINDNITNRVVINYGGHSDVHTSVNKGQHWQDHTGGPPSRRVVHSAPHRERRR